MRNLFSNTYNGQTVLVTGHTGFKGSWLTTWLLEMGANVIGYSLDQPPTNPSHFELAHLGQHVTDVRGDLADFAALRAAIETYQPAVVFHLAAQPIVLRSVSEPKLTFDVNAAGTVNVLEAVRATSSVRAVVCITTDKVYADKEWLWGYRENDELGGFEPYGASKAMAELAIQSYRRIYFPPDKYPDHQVAIASARAGNVIGGGDFAPYRLVPDCMKALLAGETVPIRNPASVRPWQHVLEPLSGYLLLGAKLLREGVPFAEAWNFGPLDQTGVSTRQLVEELICHWGEGDWEHTHPNLAQVETHYLRLNCEKAARYLQWRPVYTLPEAAAEITTWFRAYQAKEDMHETCRQHIRTYVNRAKELDIAWARP